MLKNKKEILREFNKEKYALLLNKFQKNKNIITLKEIDRIAYGDKYKIAHLIKIKKKIVKYIIKYKIKNNTLVEFGCGYGSVGLFLIKNKNFKSTKFIFLDIANNGIEVIKKLALQAKINKKRFKTGHVDIYNGKLEKKILIPKNSIFITVGSMMYRKKHNNKFLNLFLKNNFDKILFFEPIYEHNLNNKKICNYFIKNNYHQNFLEILKRNKKIRIILEKKNLFRYNNKNLPYSLIV